MSFEELEAKKSLAFVLLTLSLFAVVIPTAAAETMTVENYQVEFDVVGGTVSNILLDPDFIELIVEINSTEDGILEISFPRELLDAKFEQQDDIFFVIVEGFETEYLEITNGADRRTILIPFFLGDTLIEIIGTDALEVELEELILQPEPEPEEIEIPAWIKNNAGWWAEGRIGDSDFVSGIQFLITEDIMTIPPTESGSGSSQPIPAWIKNNAGWWAEGRIGDSDFVSGIQFLITEGIMQI
ncbi:MAG TPA: hypothetical protein ENH95_07845 [Nitrosopumilus sp.]|nr:hypothetical protein [Nitrosopumilus sp.]